MKDIVLCATQRCGSTMVVEDMRNTGVMGQPEEWFIPWDPAKNTTNWEKALSSVRKRATGENGVLAIKVMANQLYNVDACLKTFIGGPDGECCSRVAKEFENAVWVKLTRRDIVGQAISRVMSRQTGINHATAAAEDAHFAGNLQAGYQKDYNKGTVYRYGAILRETTAITLENLAWDRFFAANQISFKEIFYEDIADDTYMSHLDVIAEMAGIDGPIPKFRRKLVKLANGKNRKWRNQFFADAAARNFRAKSRS